MTGMVIQGKVSLDCMTQSPELRRTKRTYEGTPRSHSCSLISKHQFMSVLVQRDKLTSCQAPMLPDPFRLTTVPRRQQFSFLILSWQQLIAFRDTCQRMFKCLDCCTRNQWSFCKNQGHLRDNTTFVHPSCTHLSFLPQDSETWRTEACAWYSDQT